MCPTSIDWKALVQEDQALLDFITKAWWASNKVTHDSYYAFGMAELAEACQEPSGDPLPIVRALRNLAWEPSEIVEAASSNPPPNPAFALLRTILTARQEGALRPDATLSAATLAKLLELGHSLDGVSSDALCESVQGPVPA